jgi:hypothetical protein
MITEAKDLLEKVIKARVENVTVVRLFEDEQHELMIKKFPLVSLITNQGKFDVTAARTYRYFNDNKEYKQCYVRGNRTIPIVIRCYADNEAAADKILSRVIPAIPSRWVYDDFTGEIEIGVEEHSDIASNVLSDYCSAVEVTFIAAAAMDADDLPYFNKVEFMGGEIVNKI